MAYADVAVDRRGFDRLAGDATRCIRRRSTRSRRQRATRTLLIFRRSRDRGLGIQNVWTGWAVMILAIVGTLSVVGLLLRRLPNFGEREEHDNPRAVL